MKKISIVASALLVLAGIALPPTESTLAAPFDTGSCTLSIAEGSPESNGTPANDIICVTGNVNFSAGDGDDVVFFAPGSSGSVRLGNGNDTLYGEQAQRLTISGEAGDDVIYGSNGNDTIDGGSSSSKDQIYANGGDDSVSGNQGENIYADLGAGNDIFNGGAALDSEIFGGTGDDKITGTTGDDDLDGGDGLDEISGLAGSDLLKGGPGDDLLAGGDGLDTLDGGFGLNFCDYSSGEVKTGTCIYDDSAPTIKSFVISSSSVNSSVIANKVDVTVEISDDTGLESASIGCLQNNSFTFLISYSNNGSGWVGVTDGNPFRNPTSGAGTGKTVKFTASVNFPIGSTPGICKLIASTRDTIGNQIGGIQLGSFEIIRTTTGDDSGPSVTISQVTNEIDVSNGSKTLAIEAAFSDPSKIQWVSINLCNNNYRYYAWWDTNSRAYIASQTILGATKNLGSVNSGLETQATFVFPIEFAAVTRSQTCDLVVSASDRNNKNSSSKFSDFLKVLNTQGGDQAGPVLENFSHTKAIDVGASSQKFEFSGRITDLTGFKWFNIRVHNSDFSRFFDVLHFQSDKYGNSDYVVTGGAGTNGPIAPSQGNKNGLDFSYSYEIPFGTKPGAYRIAIMGEDLLGNPVVDPGNYFLEISRTSPGQPSAPSKVNATPTGPDSATLSWSAPEKLGTPALKDYEIQFRLDSETLWRTISDGYSISTQIPISNLLGGKIYQFRVRGENGGGQGSWSSITSLATEGAKAPSVPLNLKTKNIGSSSFLASWDGPIDAGASKITDFVAQISNDGLKWTTIGHAASPSLSITVNNLLPETSYMFRVAWVNGLGSGKFSNPVSIKTLVANKKTFVAPSAPRTPKISKVNSKTYKLSWLPPSAIGGDKVIDYVSEYSSDKGKTWIQIESSFSPSTSVKISGLKKNRLYQLRISAVNRAGQGPWSKVSSLVAK